MANTAELIVRAALRGLAAGRVYPDVAPAGVAKPYITFQSVGGQSPNTLRGAVINQNARMQVAAWATTRDAASLLIQEVAAALVTDEVGAVTIGAAVSVYESDTKLYGSRQDFSIWFLP